MQRGLPWSDGPQQHPDTPPPSPAASRRRLREIAWREAERRAGGGGRRRACHLFSQIRAATAPDANPIAPLFPSLFPVVKSSGASASSSATQHDELGPEATHEPVERHFKIPHGVFMREATSVTVDSDDNCYVFNRGNVPVLVFDPSGNLINDWGNHTPYDGTESCESPWPTDAFNGPGTASPASILRYRGTEYVRPHMIRWSEYDGTLWLVDDMANTITQCDRNGTRLLVLRPKGVVLRTPDDIAQAVGDIAEPPAAQSGEMFNRPTDCCVHPETGDIFIADGCVHHINVDRAVCCLLPAACCLLACCCLHGRRQLLTMTWHRIRPCRYGNSRIHRLKADGSWIMSWGESGTDENQFYCPHNISISDDGTKVLVADRCEKQQLFSAFF